MILGFSYMFSGIGIINKWLHTARTKTPFLISENYRRLPDDVVFTGIIRKLAGIPIQDVDGIESIVNFQRFFECTQPKNFSNKRKLKFFTRFYKIIPF